MTVHENPDQLARPRVGFVGLGIMGTPMAAHLADAGYPLTVYDIDAAASSALGAARPGVVVAGPWPSWRRAPTS